MRRCIEFESYIPGRSIEEVKKAYGLEKVVKLASNENPYGASPKAIEVVRNFTDLHRYPNAEYKEL
ncbi:MAG: histidinol-phosphate aminotransferase, partial [Archaeoglobaceae archaeon]|nr:histidinol-phosphate aminotransferase [Archaeoglobaceae archaeon]MDW8118462.1 histidinol-phosphate aminotransferase [Archaeoglobaceae archaeon]